MFYLKRERQERAAGRSERDALEVAAATSGRSVLISGLTVMVAMAGLFLTGDAIFASFGIRDDDRGRRRDARFVDRAPGAALEARRRRRPAARAARRPARRADGEGRIWGAIVDLVLRRPLLSALVSGGLLVASPLPALQLRMATAGPEAAFPKSLDVIKAYDRMQEAFPGTALPANVVVKAADVNAPAMREAIAAARAAALRERPDGRADHGRGQQGRHGREHHRSDREAREPTPASNSALAELRDEIVPETVGAFRAPRPASPA